MIDLRYISILTIFSSSILGSLIPFFINESFRPFIKMFSAGVILALSLVHIIPGCLNDLSNISKYPLGGTMILIGILFLVIIENVSHSLLSKESEKLIDNSHEDKNHNHVCINNLNLSNLSCVPDNKYTTSPFMLYIFECACIFHSFIIGLSLGLITEQDNIKKLMVALIFHQMIEGMSLGAMIISSQTKKLKSCVFIVSYSIMTPLGVTTGLIIEKTSSSHNDLNDGWRISRGCLLGLSSGILIYISLIQIIIEELSKKDLHAKSSIIKKIFMHLSTLVGAGIMCIIALWV